MTKALQRKVERWNERHPVGTAVLVARDSGAIELTTTRSGAWVLSGHTAVIMLAGISGCYDLGRVVPAGLARTYGPDAAGARTS